VAVAVAAGNTVKQAAKATGLSARQVRWVKARPEVRRRVAELVAEMSARSVMLAAFAALTPEQRAEVARLLLWPGRAATTGGV